MKRLTAIFICLTIILGLGLLTGCNTPEGKDAYDLYLKMQDAMSGVKSLDMDMSAITELTSAGSTMKMDISGNIKTVKNSDTDFDMSMYLKSSMMGMDFDTTSYYTGGALYSETMGMKSKMAMPSDEAMQQAGGVEILDFPETAIKDFKITNADGGKKIAFTLNGKDIKSVTDQAIESMQAMNPFMSTDNLSIDISDVICEVVIDKNNMLKSYKMVYDIIAAAGGADEMGMKIDMSIDVNSYNDVTIELPSDLDSYIDMTGSLDSYIDIDGTF
jgi:predicted small secreted protein